MSKWQGIETAPKDGQFYLAYDGRSFMVENCPPDCWPGVWEKQLSEWRGAAHSAVFGATHWMPLPDPPNQGDK